MKSKIGQREKVTLEMAGYSKRNEDRKKPTYSPIGFLHCAPQGILIKTKDTFSGAFFQGVR